VAVSRPIFPATLVHEGESLKRFHWKSLVLKRLLPPFLLGLGLLPLAAMVFAEENPGITEMKGRLDQLVSPLIQNSLFPGMVIGINIDGHPYVFAYGECASHPEIPNGDMGFEIGSVTKLFTKLLLVNMVHQGLMRLDDPIQNYLPSDVQLPVGDKTHITLLELAQHTSGLPRNPDDEDLKNPNDWGDYSTDQLYSYLGRCQLVSAPGARFFYSNTGFGLLGDLIGLKKNMSYEAFLRNAILEPLGMTRTGISWSEDQLPFAAQGFDGDGNPLELWKWNSGALVGAAGIHSTENDLMKLAESFFDEERSPLKGWAFGPSADELGLGNILSYDGGTDGFFASFYANRKERKAVVFLADCNNLIGLKLARKIQDLVVNHLPSGPFPIPKFVQLSEQLLRNYQGRYEILSVSQNWRLLPGDIYVLKLEKGKLVGHLEGDIRRSVLYPESEKRFYIKSLAGVIEILTDSKGLAHL